VLNDERRAVKEALKLRNVYDRVQEFQEGLKGNQIRADISWDLNHCNRYRKYTGDKN